MKRERTSGRRFHGYLRTDGEFMLENEPPEDGNIMDYPVLGHYDLSVEATAESGGDEQDLLCEYISRDFRRSFLLARAPKENTPLVSIYDLFDRELEHSERREITTLP